MPVGAHSKGLGSWREDDAIVFDRLKEFRQDAFAESLPRMAIGIAMAIHALCELRCSASPAPLPEPEP